MGRASSLWDFSELLTEHPVAQAVYPGAGVCLSGLGAGFIFPNDESPILSFHPSSRYKYTFIIARGSISANETELLEGGDPICPMSACVFSAHRGGLDSFIQQLAGCWVRDQGCETPDLPSDHCHRTPPSLTPRMMPRLLAPDCRPSQNWVSPTLGHILPSHPHFSPSSGHTGLHAAPHT